MPTRAPHITAAPNAVGDQHVSKSNMESFSAMIFVCLALCILPQVHSLECYMCGPESPCGPANKDKRTCDAASMEDMCGILVVNSVTIKNCTSSLGCSPSSIGNPCVQMNMSAPACSVSCCRTDLCNMAAVSSSSSSPGPQPIISREAPGTSSSAPPKSQKPTSGTPELTANFVAVIITVMLAKVVKPFCFCLSMF
ncbi:PREDICTED: uncharacterized protein LOC107342314 isoform X5 [Acropora digitifera]|uniref:uncharacterized protein LOC107342314 isoform X5 n=1 Tax=Acropora digitifera TaxID=70779 RepID=UPI00077A52B5|nr:PREDICTED: uncharacterized protein LOC107342314 isoform X5 [Acropora digitifera]